MKLAKMRYILSMLISTFALVVRPSEAELCTKDICEYTLTVRRWATMVYPDTRVSKQSWRNAYDVELNGTKLQIKESDYHLRSEDAMIGQTVDPNDVITGDGFPRTVITINDQFPGPELEVLEGAQVVVRLVNKMRMESISVHWHGLHQRDTVWMDGVPMITQCPIPPGQSFTYRFIADPPGTHWYHSHMPTQRLDGLFGYLIVHRRNTQLGPSFNVMIHDWNHQDTPADEAYDVSVRGRPGSGRDHMHVSLRHFTLDSCESGDRKFHSALVNGRGRYNNEPYPLTEFIVKKDQKYRFRFTNSGNLYAFEVSIDEHMMEVVAVDGSEIQPITVTSVMVFAGERIDVDVTADQLPNRYWMRTNTLRVGVGIWPTPDGIEIGGKAIVAYEGDMTGDPRTTQRICSGEPCIVFNCPYGFYPTYYNKSCVRMSEARSTMNQTKLDGKYGLQDTGDQVMEYFLNVGFNRGPSINARIFEELPVPYFDQNMSDHIVPCGEECDTNGCTCSHIQKLPYNRTIQLVLSSYLPGGDDKAHHSIHLHGHDFAIMRMGVAEQNETTGHWTKENPDITCKASPNERLCAKPSWTTGMPALNKDHPPIKDTIMIPARGYVVVRFRSDNPGHWLMHCHQEPHLLLGLGMVFTEAESMIKALPKVFPQCTPFDWTNEDFQDFLKSSKPISEVATVIPSSQFITMCIVGVTIIVSDG